MFRILTFDEFFREHKPKKSVYLSRNDPGCKCVTSGFIHNMHLAGCRSLAIFYEKGNTKIGASTHYDCETNEHLREINKNLILKHKELIHSRDVALFWNRRNPSSRYNPGGDVYQLLSGVKNIFRDAEVLEIPYEGFLDSYGLSVDDGILVLPSSSVID
jgi:hypothetical protein